MGVDKEYIIEHCRDKQRSYGIDICMIQTEPCKRAVEMDRCPKVWEFYRMTDSEKPNNCEDEPSKDFTEFLFNVIPPNDMEDYMSIWKSQGIKECKE